MPTNVVLFNRAQFRDDIRRKMAINPPIDMGTGNAGDAPPGQPNPNNPVMNSFINEAIRTINRAARCFSVADLSVPVAAAATTKRGAAYVDLLNVAGFPTSLFEVRQVIWDDGSGNPIRLQPIDFYEPQRGYVNFEQWQPSSPRLFQVFGQQIILLAAPVVAGTLLVSIGEGLDILYTDSDTIPRLPSDFQDIVQYLAITLFARTQTKDAEMQARLAGYQDLAQAGLQAIVDWRNGYFGPMQPSIVIDPQDRTANTLRRIENTA